MIIDYYQAKSIPDAAITPFMHAVSECCRLREEFPSGRSSRGVLMRVVFSPKDLKRKFSSDPLTTGPIP